MSIPIVILHGWGASAKSYDKLKPLLEQKGISVFVFDLPGFGNESAPNSAWAIDDYVEWVREVIERNMNSKNKTSPQPPPYQGGGVNGKVSYQGGGAYGKVLYRGGEDRKIILFGHSFGGRIAIKFAVKYPEKLAGLILCDAAGITPRPKLKINLFTIISKTGKIIFSLPILRYFQPIVRKIEYFLAGSRDYYYLQNPIMREIFKKVIGEDLTPYLEKIKATTLIAWGKKDKMTPVSDAYVMNDKIRESKLEILEGIGHSPHLENPQMLADIIFRFIIQIDNNSKSS